jgi:integrase
MASSTKPNVLTVEKIKGYLKLKIEKLYPDGTANLYLHTRKSGKGYWEARVTVNGKRVPIRIGPYEEGGLTAVRKITPRIVALVKDGYAVQAIRNALATTLVPDEIASLVKGEKISAHRATPTFEEVGRDWYHKHVKNGLSEGRYKLQLLEQLEHHVFPTIGRRPINEIKRREIIEALQDIWVKMHRTGVKIRSTVDRVFDYAVDHELRDDNPTPPPRSMPLHQHQVQHFKSLPYERVQEFWVWLMSRDQMTINTKVGLALAVLQGKRTGEIQKMRWEHIDFKTDVWTTPPTDMKKRKAHRQPLPSQLIEMLNIIKDASNGKGYVLANAEGRTISGSTMLNAIKKFDDITTHGFRATLGSWCTDDGVDKQVSDFIKSHQPKYLDAAYSRTDMLEERRDVLQRWANFVTGTVGGGQGETN